MNQRLDVIGVQCQGTIQLLQRLVRLSGERIRETEQVMSVRKRAARRNHLFEQMNRAIIVLQLKSFVSLLDQMLGTDVHESPRTNRRTCECRLRCPPAV